MEPTSDENLIHDLSRRHQHADSVLPARLRDDALLPELTRRPIPGEVIRHLPTARATPAPSEVERAELIRGDQIKYCGEELRELALVCDWRDPGDPNNSAPLVVLVTAWLAGDFSAATREGYQRDIREFFLWCRGRHVNPAPSQIGWYDVEMYARHLAEATPDQTTPGRGATHYSEATRARYLNAVASFYTFCHLRHQSVRNPAEGLKPPAVPKNIKRRTLLTHEQDLLWKAACSHTWDNGGDLRRLTMRVVVALGLDHGWRVGEFTTASIKDLTIWRTRDDGRPFRAVERHLKGCRTEIDVLSDRAADAITDMLTARGYDLDVWEQHSGLIGSGAPATIAPGPLIAFKLNRAPDPKTVRTYLTRLCVVAGINPGTDTNRRRDRVTPHALRRSMGTTARDKGHSLEDVAQMLHHSDPKTTLEHYDMHRDDPARSPIVRLGLATPWEPR